MFGRLVGFASDGAAVMQGIRAGVSAKLKGHQRPHSCALCSPSARAGNKKCSTTVSSIPQAQPVFRRNLQLLP